MYKTAVETSAAIAKLAPMVAGAAARRGGDLRAVRESACGDRGRAWNQYRNRRAGRFLAEGGRVHRGGIRADAEGIQCQWVIIGHSERRQYFGETEETVAKKTAEALHVRLKPIVCVGERLEQRESGATDAVLAGQFEGGLGGLSAGTVRGRGDRL